MPYGFPGLDAERLHTLTEWLEQGAPGVPAALPSAAEQQSVDEWETFLNGDSLKEQLMSRYIYEHLFIGSLYFDEFRAPGTGTASCARARRRASPST
jgi:hypothetical protein